MRGRRNLRLGAGRFSIGAVLALCACGLVLPPAASAATTLGSTFPPTASSGDATHITSPDFGGPLTVPFKGVITSWSVAGHPSFPFQVKLKVGRPAGPPTGGPGETPAVDTYTIVGESTQHAAVANTLNTYAARVPVDGGDRLGLFSTSFFGRALGAGSSTVRLTIPGDQAVGTTAMFPIRDEDWQLNLAAQLESDADDDGYGDESQDNCLGSPGPENGCPAAETPPEAADAAPPDTTITEFPRKRRNRHSSFAFTSSEPGSSFSCSLDGGPSDPCSSPKDYRKLKRGPHTFEVFAIDAAGNADPSPASHAWRVKKKKKR